MRISEIFHSIQGEGVNAGKEAVFVRFFGCNLACSWCDTKYSWHPKYAEYEHMDLAQIIEKIKGFNCPHVIFTGGEPALYQKEIREIISSLPPEFTYEIESNGTIPLDAIEQYFEVVNISPKLKNSGNASELKALNPEYYYKFVIVSEEDMPEILALRDKHCLQNILLMPEGKTRMKQEKSSPVVLELCRKYGMRFSPRLHALLWNGEKGK